jgi:hypothetical protein
MNTVKIEDIKDEKTNDVRVGIVCRFSEMKCSICHTEFEKNDKIKIINGHKIHIECLKYFDKICCCSDCNNAIYV